MGERFDIIDGVLGLTTYRDVLVLVHMPCVLCIHENGAVFVHHLDVDAVGTDVGESDIERGGGHAVVFVGSYCSEGLPTLGIGGCRAHLGVVPFLAVCPRPMDVNHARPHLFGIGIVCVGVQRDGVFDLGFGTWTADFDLWGSVLNHDLQGHVGRVPFFVLNGDDDGVDAVVDPRIIQHAGRGEDSLP